MRQARMDLGGRIADNLEDEDIEVLFEDAADEYDPPRYRTFTSGPPGHEITTTREENATFFENKGNVKRMEKARRELVTLIRKWMHEAKESPV